MSAKRAAGGVVVIAISCMLIAFGVTCYRSSIAASPYRIGLCNDDRFILIGTFRQGRVCVYDNNLTRLYDATATLGHNGTILSFLGSKRVPFVVVNGLGADAERFQELLFLRSHGCEKVDLRKNKIVSLVDDFDMKESWILLEDVDGKVYRVVLSPDGIALNGLKKQAEQEWAGTADEHVVVIANRKFAATVSTANVLSPEWSAHDNTLGYLPAMKSHVVELSSMTDPDLVALGIANLKEIPVRVIVLPNSVTRNIAGFINVAVGAKSIVGLSPDGSVRFWEAESDGNLKHRDGRIGLAETMQ